jgi:hypothetical protein
MPFRRRGQFFLLVAEFYGHSGWIILKRVVNTGKRENKYCQVFLQAYFKGKPQMLWYLYISTTSIYLYVLINPCFVQRYAKRLGFLAILSISPQQQRFPSSGRASYWLIDSSGLPIG